MPDLPLPDPLPLDPLLPDKVRTSGQSVSKLNPVISVPCEADMAFVVFLLFCVNPTDRPMTRATAARTATQILIVFFSGIVDFFSNEIRRLGLDFYEIGLH